ncbi:MAG: hypothetical protein AAB562_01290 [Patescibacteria group bacterium]
MRRVLLVFILLFATSCYHMRSTVRTPTTAYDSLSVGVGAPASSGYGHYGSAPYAAGYPIYRVPMWRAPSESWSMPAAATPPPVRPGSPAPSASVVPGSSGSADDARLSAVEAEAKEARKRADRALKSIIGLEPLIKGKKGK